MRDAILGSVNSVTVMAEMAYAVVSTAVVSVLGPPAGERRAAPVKTWQAWGGVIGLSAIIFGAGIGFAIWGLGFAEAPEKLATVELRLDRVEGQLHILVCELRDERGAPLTVDCATGVLR